MAIRAVLFDLDGLLVDSERESAEAMARVLSRDHGVPVTDEQREYVYGHSWNEIYAHLKAAHGERLSWSMAELIARSSKERAAVIAEQGLTVLPGARSAVSRLVPRYKTAIVTGSSRAEAGQALRFLGFHETFGLVVAAEDYARGKPAPDGYLKAAAALGVAPAECLVLEDSSPGIAAGVAAGMTVVAVRAGNFQRHDQSAAHVIVDTLDDVTDELIEHLTRAA